MALSQLSSAKSGIPRISKPNTMAVGEVRRSVPAQRHPPLPASLLAIAPAVVSEGSEDTIGTASGPKGRFENEFQWATCLREEAPRAAWRTVSREGPICFGLRKPRILLLAESAGSFRRRHCARQNGPLGGAFGALTGIESPGHRTPCKPHAARR